MTNVPATEVTETLSLPMTARLSQSRGYTSSDAQSTVLPHAHICGCGTQMPGVPDVIAHRDCPLS